MFFSETFHSKCKAGPECSAQNVLRSCLCCGTWPRAVTESHFCAATSCSVARYLFVKLQNTPKMVLTGFAFLNWLVFIPSLHYFPCLHSHGSQHFMAFGTFVVAPSYVEATV